MNPDRVIEKIKHVEIQGATNIAREGVRLLQEMDERGASEDRIEEVREELLAARPTEPMLHNAVRIADATGDFEAVLGHIDTARGRILEHAAGLVSDGDIVYTHCHSSTVVDVLLAAYEDHDFEVRVTETRPLYQGRDTATELAKNGVPVTMYVDSGARIALKDTDKMFIGADAVGKDGAVTNKIGSEMFAEVAQMYDNTVHVLTNAWKYDPHKSFGYDTDLEERIPGEVWAGAPSGVEIKNYAFEHVAPDAIDMIVSELGRHDPEAFAAAASKEYPELTPPAQD